MNTGGQKSHFPDDRVAMAPIRSRNTTNKPADLTAQSVRSSLLRRGCHRMARSLPGYRRRCAFTCQYSSHRVFAADDGYISPSPILFDAVLMTRQHCHLRAASRRHAVNCHARRKYFCQLLFLHKISCLKHRAVRVTSMLIDFYAVAA